MRTPVETFGYAAAESPVGNILVVTSTDGVVASFTGESADILLLQARRRFPHNHFKENAHHATQALAAALKHIANPARPYGFPLDIRTTPFRKAVWEAILTVPLGEVATYRDIARLAGSPRAMRAVGSACAECDFSGIIPCHRILRSGETFATNQDTATLHRHALLQREQAFLKKP